MDPIPLHYSKKLLRKAVLTFWLRVTGWRFWAACFIALASFVYLLEIGDRSWFVGVIGTVITGAFIFAVTIYVVHYRSAMVRLRRMRVPESVFEPGEDKMRMASDAGSTEVSWRVVTEVWRYPDFWLVFFSRAQFITLPTADLSLEAREFIVDRIKAHGGKIT